MDIFIEPKALLNVCAKKKIFQEKQLKETRWLSPELAIKKWRRNSISMQNDVAGFLLTVAIFAIKWVKTPIQCEILCALQLIFYIGLEMTTGSIYVKLSLKSPRLITPILIGIFLCLFLAKVFCFEQASPVSKLSLIFPVLNKKCLKLLYSLTRFTTSFKVFFPT